MEKTRFGSIRKLSSRSTYLSDIFEAEDKKGRYIVKKNRVKLTETQHKFLDWLVQNPHPNLLIPTELNVNIDRLEEVYEYIEWPLLSDILLTLSPQDEQANYNWGFSHAWVIIEKLTYVLGYLHANGFIHHDVKANNLFINPQGLKVKLFDYNSVREPYFLEHGINTWDDVPPEYEQGNTQIDFRFDVYQAGRLLFKMTHHYLPNNTKKVLRPNTPSEVVEIIHKASHKNRDQRYNDCNEMHGAIKNLEKFVI